MDILYIIAPAYNEAENITQFVDAWYPVVEAHNGNGDSRLVVIDDGSLDDTYAILQGLATDRPLLTPLTKPNGGHGATLLYGYRYANESGADYIFQTDSDGQTDPVEFEAFWERREKYDAILGHRSDRRDGASRVFVEQTLLRLLRLIFGVRMPDANAPFRLMKKDLVAKYLPKMPADFNLPNVMLSTYFVYYKENVTFRAISFKPRQGGTNSINMKRIIGIGRKAVAEFWTLRKQMDE